MQKMIFLAILAFSSLQCRFGKSFSFDPQFFVIGRNYGFIDNLFLAFFLLIHAYRLP